mgnify:CR=1 FL=1
MNGRAITRFGMAFGLAVFGLAMLMGMLVGRPARAESPSAPAVEDLRGDRLLLPVPLSQWMPGRRPLENGGAGAIITVCRQAGVCAYAAVQSALDVAQDGDVIKVAQGVYSDVRVTGGYTHVVYITQSVTVRGGYTTTDWTTFDPDAYPTVLDGAGRARVLYVAEDGATVEGFHIQRGQASQGGGVYVATGSPVMRRNRVYSNTADGDGGGVYVFEGSPLLENNLLYANEAGDRGGAIYARSGSPTIWYNTLHGNQARWGGGVYVASGTPLLNSSIIVSNTASSEGGGIYRGGGSFTPVYNNVWGNAGGNYGGFGGTIPGTDQQADPRFIDPGRADFRLAAGSPCIGRADPGAYPDLDYDGYVRSFGPRADVGAFERYAGACFVRVGESRVYTTVQEAVDVASAGDEVLAAGYCTGEGDNVVEIDKSLTLRGGYTATDWLASDPDARRTVLDGEGVRRVIYINQSGAALIEGLDIYNGFIDGIGGGIYVANDQSSVTIRHNRIYSNSNWVLGSTENGSGIHLSGKNPVVASNEIYANVAAGSGGGMYVAGNVQGATITDNRIYGNSANNGAGLYSDGETFVRRNWIYSNTVNSQGGGIHVGIGGSGRVENNRIYSNTAVQNGGGIYVASASILVIENRIYDNVVSGTGAWDGGGGIYAASGIVRSNVVFGNQATEYGGGVFAYNPGTLVDRNRVYGNEANEGGGVMLRNNAEALNNLVYTNIAASNGGGIRIRNGRVINNVLYDNVSGGNGGGVHADGTKPGVVIYGNIVVHNTSGSGGTGINGGDARWNNVWGNTCVGDCSDNLSADPLFEDWVDFYLQPDSPCIDAIITTTETYYAGDDYDGYARPFGQYADVGAREFYTGTCFARLVTGGQVYTSVQQVVDIAAVSGADALAAGYCAGDQGRVVITQPLALRGGYTKANWISPTAETTLDALRQGWVIEIDVPDPSATVTVEGFVVRGGDAGTGNGGGIYVRSALSPTIQNVVFYDNVAGSAGGGFASAGGNPRLHHVTFVSNTATTGGGVYFFTGEPTLDNSIVVSNAATTGGGVFASTDATPTLDYNDVWGNSAGTHPNANVFTGVHSFSLDPQFENDYRLGIGSPCLHQGAPTGLAWDFEGDPRGRDSGPDLGADERAVYPDLRFAPPHLEGAGVLGEPTLYTHYLTNTGGLDDIYILTHSLTYSGGVGWAVDYPDLVALAAGDVEPLPVAVSVPTDSISGTWAVLVLTATSSVNPWVQDVVSNTTLVEQNPGVRIEPAYVRQVNPGMVLTYVHMLVNTGNGPDSFELTFDSVWGWSGMTPTQILDMGPHATATVWVSVTVPLTAPGGLVERSHVVARSLENDVEAEVLDTTEVNHTPGDRYVAEAASGGSDTLNNCQVYTHPCSTIAYGTAQATNRDVVKVAEGIYHEYDLTLNKDVTLRGGHSRDDWSFDPERHPTVVDAQGRGRVFNIFGGPTVEGFTLQGGQVDGAGGAIYVGLGQPTIKRNRITGNTANRGGGFALGAGAPNFWNNFVYGNTATQYGGGIYVAGGGGNIWHDTIYSNTATRGGGLYVVGGNPVINNLIVVSNTATDAGGGVYSSLPISLDISYSNIWGNVNGRCDGAVSCSTGDGNIAVDPLLVNPAGGDLHLQAGSPCIDVGGPTTLREDFDGQARWIGDMPDMGADEYQEVGVELEPGSAGNGDPGETVIYEHVLTNTGNYTDTFTFKSLSSQGWRVSIPNVVVGPGLTTVVPVGVQIPNDALSGTVDVTVITVTSEADPGVFDTAVDTTTVNLIYGVIIEPDLTQMVESDPLETVEVVYSHTLRNEGNNVDTFNLTWVSELGFDVTIAPVVSTLGAGEETGVQVIVTVPATSTDVAMLDVVTITATSQISITVKDEAIDTTIVNYHPGVEFTPDRTGQGINGETITYTHILTNTGNFTDTFSFSAVSTQPSWGISLPSAVVLGAGLTATVQVYVIIPYEEFGGTVHVMTVTAASQFSPTVMASVVDETTVEKVAGASLLSSVGACIPDASSSSTQVSYGHILTNTGNFSDTFDIDAESQHNWLAGSVPSQLTLAPIWSREVHSALLSIEVTVPPTTNRFIDCTTTTVYSSLYTTPTATAQQCVKVNWGEGVTLEPDRHGFAHLVDHIVYSHTLTNVNTQTNEIHLWVTNRLIDIFEGRRQFPAVIEPNYVVLDPGVSTTIWVTVSLPDGKEVSTETGHTVVVASPTHGCGQGVIDKTTVFGAGMSFEKDEERAVAPGHIVTYTHWLSNNAFIMDTFVITYSSELGWPVQITPSLLYTLPPESKTPVYVQVEAPPDVIAGTVDVLVITATLQHNGVDTDIFDTVRDETEVIYVPGALIAPPGYGSADPGGTIMYTHSLTNTGNYTESFDLTTHSVFGYAVVSPTAIGPLGPGAVYTNLQLMVAVPEHASRDETERTEVIATFASVQEVALDLTTINPVTGTRYVAPNGRDVNNNCTDVFGYGPCRTVQHAVAEAQDGNVIKVAQGVYADLSGRGTYTQVLYLDKDVILQGGYAADPVGDGWDVADPLARPTILDAGAQGRVVYVVNGTAPALEGFYLRGGYVDGDGAGVYVAADAQPTIRDNVIYGNRTADDAGQAHAGGGLYYAGDADPAIGPTFERNTVYDNRAGRGAGVYVADGSPNLWNNVVYSNVAEHEGGGLYLATEDLGAPLVWHNTIYHNQAYVGGGIYIASGYPVVSNTIVVSNSAGNSATDTGGVYRADGMPTLAYNNVWGNAPLDYAGGITGTGTGSLSADARFVAPAEGDLRLRRSSPCVDAGYPTTTLFIDRDGNARPLRDGYDIGAYEQAVSGAKMVTETADPGTVITYTVVVTNIGEVAQSVRMTDALNAAYLDCRDGVLDYDLGAGVYDTALCRVDWRGSVPVSGSVSDGMTRITFTAAIRSWLAAGTVVTNVAWVDADPTAVVSTVIGSYPGPRYVSPTGFDEWNNCLEPDLPCRTVQSAVDQAWDGDPIFIAAGVYTGAGRVVSVTQKSLALHGGYTPTLPVWTRNLAVYRTALDAEGGAQAVTIAGPATVTLSGLHVYGGGDGVRIDDGALTLENMWVYGNTGVGVEIDAAGRAYTMTNNVLAQNGNAGLRATGDGTLRHNTFADNAFGAVITGAARFTNTIFSTHTVGVDATGGSAELAYTLWYANDRNQGDINSENEWVDAPMFRDPAGADYHIEPGSAAVDRGVDAGVYADVDGDRRPLGLGYDLGADELRVLVSVTKAVTPPVVSAGERLTYTIHLSNDGDMDLQATITDTLPAGVMSESKVWTTGLPTSSPVWRHTFPVTAAWSYSGTLTNWVHVTSDEGASAVYSVAARAVTTPALDVRKKADPAVVEAGERFSYTIWVTNTGNVDLHAHIVDEPSEQVTTTQHLVWTPTIPAPGGVWSHTFPVTAHVGYSGAVTNTVWISTEEGVNMTCFEVSEVIPPICPYPLEGVWIDGRRIGRTGYPYRFTAHLTPTDPSPPITYTWSPEPDVGQGSQAVTYTRDTPNLYSLTLTVDSCGGVFSDTHVISISACIALEQVTIVGPQVAYSGTIHTFTAVPVPLDASDPITYTWSPPPFLGQGESEVSYRWAVTGTQIITVAAENCGGWGVDTYTIEVGEARYPIYLPLVMRDYR